MSRAALSRDEVLQSQQSAWVEADSVQYFYDGAAMWRSGDPGTPVAADEAPLHGWRHPRACHCPLCRKADGAPSN
jgi:hypothetical protein